MTRASKFWIFLGVILLIRISILCPPIFLLLIIIYNLISLFFYITGTLEDLFVVVKGQLHLSPFHPQWIAGFVNCSIVGLIIKFNYFVNSFGKKIK